MQVEISGLSESEHSVVFCLYENKNFFFLAILWDASKELSSWSLGTVWTILCAVILKDFYSFNWRKANLAFKKGYEKIVCWPIFRVVIMFFLT